ncbi:small subunit rRNA maturation protein TSR4 KNAG_0I01610 [Huiozyma naganishii CBS 8797]|uniref:Programmed cell death protein 2 C-terminal domain-containing protein n=1 Tax=Huiozyma naganishii (strain ATCC MYA-139 / BCRC 22969 / CBS 8797 / KCTC 17520 / NBRC 10181 / NCYC 3082 / Yp74L-3) TaxID=1071383 RepID=J7S2C1_HUIN7|nr:hypothetical protein KNAG_0I01610 [Kazachstania naganishii CBS 8797]CCK71947.1 hypothetical protein KNAG_0I01610 [Kazachstania naganishii CBS 8797]
MSRIEEVSDFDEEDGYNSKAGDVYLAYIDAPVKEVDEITVEDTFVGGEPIWLHPNSIPPSDMLKCGACKTPDHMKLLLQAFSPLDEETMESIHSTIGKNLHMNHINADNDRVLYVFICTNCQRKGNSVRCIRGVKKNPRTASLESKIKDTPEGKDFNINPFDLSQTSSQSHNTMANNPFATGTESVNPFARTETPVVEKDVPDVEPLSSKNARKLHNSLKDKSFDSSKCFKPFSLYVEEERFTNKPDHLKLPKNLKIDKDALELTGNNEEDLNKDPIRLDPRTEKLSKFLDDDVFQKFQEVVGYNPLQVLRYDIGGKPLYYAESKKKFEEIVANPGYNPSSCRIFEMQLMPKLILDLDETVSVNDGMVWGTIMVFTDAEDYIPKFDENNVGYVEESVTVQWEPSS